ncbi:MAG TPA: selenium-binding protein SBP56-related protein [Verrucomicrobiota bacterium]|nr:selenium-binding protein SBP56-related protein [Verrucomicrobiota bacterium]
MKQTTSNSWQRTPRATGSRASARFSNHGKRTPGIAGRSSFQPLKRRERPAAFFFALAALAVLTCALPLRADETCSSPYMARIEGQEEFVYVWTLGVEGLGDGADKLVTIDVKPGSPTYGKVIHSHSLDGRHEAHHGGFTDDRRQLWLSGLESSKIFIYDVYTNPAKPRHIKTIENFEKITGGAVGPHGVYALPGRVLIPCLSNSKDHGGRTALVEFSNDGDYIATHWLPTKDTPGLVGAEFADGYGYDARVLPRKNVMLTTSFTGWKNYTRNFGELVQDADAMKQFGNSMVLWNFHTRQPKKAFHVPGAPLEIRWAWGEKRNYAFTATALTSKLWLCYEDKSGEWQAKEVATIGGEGGVIPVDMSISADDKLLFVDCFGDGMVRVFDVSNPHQPKQIYEKQIGRQLNMVSQSWDGKRLYFSSSLLAKWDKLGEDNEQFVRAYNWNGKELTPTFELDFTALKLGRPHHMLFGSTKIGNGTMAAK